MHQSNRYAVFGHPISHSKSPLIHTLFAEQTNQDNFSYTAQDVTAQDFNSAVASFFRKGGKGLNCTVPLKELAWRLADKKSPRAEISKAVNTLALEPNGSIYGDNTDGIGLINDLKRNIGIELTGTRILVVGAGGASRGILKPLLDQQPHSIGIANRTVSKAEQLQSEFEPFGSIYALGLDQLKSRKFDLLINATAASLTGDLPPLPDELINPTLCCYDLAYGEKPTAFVSWATQHGARISVDGLGMLVEQAAQAFELWCGSLPKTAHVIDQLNAQRSGR